MVNQIQEVIRRTYRYQYEDGIVEISIGVLFVMIALGQFVMQYAMNLHDALWIILTSVGLMFLISVGTYMVRSLVGNLKQSITYPRSGYIEMRQKPSKRRFVVVAFSLALVLMFFVAWETESNLNQMGFIVGLWLAVVFAYMGYRMIVNRFYKIALVSLVSGIVIAFMDVPEVAGVGAVFALCGIALLLSGIRTLDVFMLENPIRSEEEV